MAVELVGQAGDDADRIEAAAGVEGGKAGRGRHRRRHAVIGVVIVIVGPARARPDREDVGVAVAQHEVGRQVADPAFMAVQPLPALDAEPEIGADHRLDETAYFEAVVDFADSGADILLPALGLELDGGSEIEDVVLAEDSEAPAFVGRFEGERVALAAHADARHRIETQRIGSGIFG